MEIIELDQSWKGHTLIFRYTTEWYYDVSLQDGPEGTTIHLERKPFDTSVEKIFDGQLFPDYSPNCRVFGVWLDDQYVAFLEVSQEDWCNRLRVNELLVKEDYRGQGIGHLLMQKAMEIAKTDGNRALVLETQTCNDPAIRFYRSCGLSVIGLDILHYSNEDIEKKEVRLELGCQI
ncbi:MAG TPA: GNAT family N-acetyltransferase [Anaerolineaceae bacterium]|nr:GNAT family N-acetyltransferase [Anaerolineaceae bacterium]